MAGEIVVLVNPAARGGRALGALEPALRRLRDAGRNIVMITGRSADDALERACTAAAEGPDALVAFGGDGLVHLAVQAVAGTDVPLGIIPAGTGNDIAAALGIPVKDPPAAADIVATGKIREIDAAVVGGGPGDAEEGSGGVAALEEWFAGVMACGFDSRVNERANRMTRPRGMARYLVALAQELRTFTPIPFSITADGEVIEREAMMVAVANTCSYGAGMRVCPDARPDDGLLDVLILGAVGKGEFLRTFPRVYRGTHTDHPAITMRRVRHITLEAADVVAYADGERVRPAPVTCVVRPGALRVLAP